MCWLDLAGRDQLSDAIANIQNNSTSGDDNGDVSKVIQDLISKAQQGNSKRGDEESDAIQFLKDHKDQIQPIIQKLLSQGNSKRGDEESDAIQFLKDHKDQIQPIIQKLLKQTQ